MMTDQQKHEIESLRKEGLSYRQIAERVGATHACIKTYFHRKRTIISRTAKRAQL